MRQSSYYYQVRRKDDAALRKRILELAQQRKRFGQYRIYLLLQREGFKANHKRVSRIYREEQLQVRRKRRKKMISGLRAPLIVPAGPNECWSMDFVLDRTFMGRRVRVLTVVDDYTRECLATEVDTSIGGLRVASVLDMLIALRGKPRSITVDNGPEFAGRALDNWAYMNKVQLNFIRPGKPIENAYIESFNGRLRDECLSGHEFMSLGQARDIIEAWRQDYNENRPHSSLGNMTPHEFAQQTMEKVKQNGARLEVLQ